MLKDICFAILFLLLGGASGTLFFIKWWSTQMLKPENLKGFLNGLRLSAESNPTTRNALDQLFPPRRLCAQCGASCLQPVNPLSTENGT